MRYVIAFTVVIVFLGSLYMFHWAALAEQRRILQELGVPSGTTDVQIKLPPYKEFLFSLERLLFTWQLPLIVLVSVLAFGIAAMMGKGKADFVPSTGPQHPTSP